jgi:hypothetical protein
MSVIRISLFLLAFACLMQLLTGSSSIHENQPGIKQLTAFDCGPMFNTFKPV